MEIKYFCGKPEIVKQSIQSSVENFCATFKPVENIINIFEDERTKAFYCECHLNADKIVEFSTIDSPLDSENQPDYRANREIVADNSAFLQMKEDALLKRSFSNIVAEYNTSFDEEHPLKIIGGQHRFSAIEDALKAKQINQSHGVKVYFGLNTEQRLDAQLISNTNIAVSPDLLDRMFETVRGPELRNWCQKVGLLNINEDFADRKQKGGKFTVRAARTFIMNYFEGKKIKCKNFPNKKTMPVLAKTGVTEEDWESLKISNPQLWDDPDLEQAGKKFAELVNSQRDYYSKTVKNSDFADKALSYAVLAAWAYVAGVLQDNNVRLERHYALTDVKNIDPLNAKILAKARHKTDPENYRGLGTRTDAKERGRMAELFYFQAEKGVGITKDLANAAIAKYYAKQAVIEADEASKKVD